MFTLWPLGGATFPHEAAAARRRNDYPPEAAKPDPEDEPNKTPKRAPAVASGNISLGAR